MEWKSIDTAPKDGSWFLGVVAGEFAPGVPFVPQVVRFCHDVNRFVDVRLQSDIDSWIGGIGEKPDLDIMGKLTYWTQFPEPPRLSEHPMGEG